VGNLKMCQRIGYDMAAHLLAHPTCNRDDLGYAFEEAISHASDPVDPNGNCNVKSFKDMVEAIGNVVADNCRSACIILTKKHTLVVAPTNDRNRYLVLNVNTKRVEYDINAVPDVVDISVISARDTSLQKDEPKMAEIVEFKEPVPKKAKLADPPPLRAPLGKEVDAPKKKLKSATKKLKLAIPSIEDVANSAKPAPNSTATL